MVKNYSGSLPPMSTVPLMDQINAEKEAAARMKEANAMEKFTDPASSSAAS